MARRKFRKRERASGATVFVIKVGLICCLLLLINAAICQLFCMFLNGVVPSLFNDLRTLQAIMYFGPILLICFEFWLYDRRVDHLAKIKHLQELESNS